MPLPNTQELYEPILEALRDETPHELAMSDMLNIAESHFDLGELSTIDRKIMRQRILNAERELTEKNLIEKQSDDKYHITSEGMKYMGYPEDEVIAIESEPEQESEPENESEQESESEPENESESEPYQTESINEDTKMNSTGIEDAIRQHNEELAEKILSGISELPTEKFEIFVIDLLSKMGYRAYHNARYTSSNLIQGVIIDEKTSSPIYIHARQSDTIGRSDMEDFIETLSDKGRKGIFATTGSFSEQAEILANDERIMLIDGMKLASLMISHDFCVKVESVYEIKDFDPESFGDYQK